MDKDERPAYVRFERRPIEDRATSLTAGHVVTKDVDYAIITPVGSRDEIPREVKDWFAQLKGQVKDQRIPEKFQEYYTRAYEAWKRGEDIPVEGTPIKGWQVLSPSQQANVLAANVRTVEDLALANGEAITRIGMGGHEIKQKAEAWLKASKEVGTVVQENSALRIRCSTLEQAIAGLEARNAALVAQVTAAQKVTA